MRKVLELKNLRSNFCRFRHAKCENSSNFYITTPIFYVNGDPHIGHLHTLILSDALFRFNKLINPHLNHYFATGTDEHGLKVQRAAQKLNIDPGIFCEKNSSKFADLCSKFNISNTDFIRTTEDRHRKAVEKLWMIFEEKNLIYEQEYEGWYSVTDETFLSKSQIIEREINGKMVKVAADTGAILEWFSETNLMFKLSQFIEPIEKHIKDNPQFIKPSRFYEECLKMLERNVIGDISVSRPSSRLHWAIDVPNNHTQKIYVWLDALANYLTAAGFPDKLNFWPPDYHVIGKDITKFHCIYWPGFLMAADLELPRTILCHSHWTIDGLKMSKSIGNVVDPFELVKKYQSQAIRYFLLKQSVPYNDGNFNEQQIGQYLNADLADNLGNLLSRCCTPSINKMCIYPATPEAQLFEHNDCPELIENLTQLSGKCEKFFINGDFYHGLQLINTCLHLANAFVNQTKPWILVKQDNTQEKIDFLLYIIFETIRICSVLLQPVVPQISEKILDKLAIPLDERLWKNAVPILSPIRKDQVKLDPQISSIVVQKIKK